MCRKFCFVLMHIFTFFWIFFLGSRFSHISNIIYIKYSWCVQESYFWLYFFFFQFIFISWGLITLQYCSGFCHTLTWINHGFTYTPHPDPPSHLPLHPIALGLPSAPGPSTCFMYPTWADVSFTLDNIHDLMLFS